MSSLCLTLKPSISGRLDLFGLVPDRLCELDVAGIAATVVSLDGMPRRVDELFTIDDGDRQRLILRGDLSQADRVGGAMIDGLLQVASGTGHRLADQMRGGVLKVAGNVGDYSCSNQRGGLVDIEGNAGEYCCGASPNFRRGMRGGTCRVVGSVGKYAGFRMRRGSLIVGGQAELGLGSSMIAGTIVAFGQVDSPIAVGMRRGTLILASPREPELHVGFTPWEAVQLAFLPILLADLQRHVSEVQLALLEAPRVMRALGDRASSGMGEILWISTPERQDSFEAGFHIAATL